MELCLSLDDPADYGLFLRVKSLPRYRFVGRTAIVPDEYAAALGLDAGPPPTLDYEPIPGLFDYQEAIARLAIRKRKFCVFLECGLGKTLILAEFARHAARVHPGRPVLVVSPLMVIDQTIAEFDRFYGEGLRAEKVAARDLATFLATGQGVGVTNYEALKDAVPPGRLAALVVDESSMLKSHYGKWGREILRLGAGLDYKLALTGTPAPNDRIEFANHAVFMDAFPTVNAFLARFFVNRGQTMNRWEMKPHALRPFYRALSDWCIFVSDPATYGWKDNAGGVPPVVVTVHDVPTTAEQDAAARALTGDMIVTDPGGIGSRSKLARIAKGSFAGAEVASHKPAFIKALVDSFGGEPTLVWCKYNDEQDALARLFPDAANIAGATPHDERMTLIADFKAGRRRVLVSKPKLLGFGLNLQVAKHQVFSTCQDSYEEYHQCVKRSNRVGSTEPLQVHIPVTELERPMLDNVLRKAAMVDADTREQEAIFQGASL